MTQQLIADRWTPGEEFCHIQEKVKWVCYGVTLYITCTLTTVKYLTVRRPLGARVWPPHQKGIQEDEELPQHQEPLNKKDLLKDL